MSSESIEGWNFYNRALMPSTPFYQEPNFDRLDRKIWSRKFDGHTPLLIRWISDYDIEKEGYWWYTVKDTTFEIENLKSYYRSYINKGRRNFTSRKIEVNEYSHEMADVAIEAWKLYSKNTLEVRDKSDYADEIRKWKKDVYGAFDHEGRLCAYLTIIKNKNYYTIEQLKARPDCRNAGVNAAIVYKLLEDMNEDLNHGIFLSNGQRNLVHETNFNDYLIKYFGFRKAYCKLNVIYSPKIEWIVKILYPFRKIVKKMDSVKIFHQINGVLLMEEIVREQKKI